MTFWNLINPGYGPIALNKGGGWVLSGSQLDLDFAYDRAFNRSTGFNGSPNGILTYTSPSQKLVYGNDGVLGYAPYNRLVQSQTFDNAAWTKGNCSVTANAGAAPDGSTTADLIIPAAASAAYKTIQHVDVNVGAAVATASIYAKASGYGFISFVATGSLGRLTIELSSGAYTNYGAALTATSTAVGDGWYRVVIKVPNWTSLAAFWVGPNSAQRDPATAWTSDGVSGAYLWGAQLVAGSSALIYVPTTSAAVYHLPIDHDPITYEPLGVLIEEQRTNLLTYSEQFDNAAWTKGAVTATANAVTAPDGATTADKVVETAATSTHNISQTATIVTATVYTYSVYAKAAERSWVCLEGGSGAGGYSVWFNLATGAVGTISGTAASNVSIVALPNGWYRCVVTDTSTGTSGVYRNYVCDADNNQSYAGNGTSGLYLWGAQLEAGAFATSYIPTGASQVTRAADQVSILTSAFGYNAAAGTVLVEGSINGNGAGNAGWWALDAGAVQNGHSLRVAIGNNIIAISRGASSNQTVVGLASPVAGTFYETAFAYSNENDRAISTDGNAVVAGTTAVGTITSATTLRLGFQQVTTTGGYLNGHIKRLTYWNIRKTNAELQALSA